VAAGVLTPLQLTAGASLLQNQGIRVAPALTNALASYNGLSSISKLISTITASGGLTANTIASLQTLGASTCPSLSNSVPSAYTGTIAIQTNPPGMSGAIITRANTYLGNGDVGKFSQAVSSILAYASTTNVFLNSAVNSQDYLANTFTGMNDTTSGDITSVNLATTTFGSELAQLGLLWDLSNLGDLGSPLALIRQMIKITGSIPEVVLSFIDYGVPAEIVVTLNDPTISVTDAAQKAMYVGMTNVTGAPLAEVLSVLGVTTPNINTMADLLNPVKLFPQSYQTLTVPTKNGLRAIYLNSQGTVNSKLADTTTKITALPDYVLSSAV